VFVVPQCFGLGCSAGDRGGAEFGGSVRAHFPVALVTCIQRTVPGTLPQHASAALGRALRHRSCGLGAYVHKRTLHTRKRTLHIHKRALHESCCSTGSSAAYPQKSPTYPQKSPTYPQKSPTYSQKSPHVKLLLHLVECYGTTRMDLVRKYVFIRKRALHIRKRSLIKAAAALDWGIRHRSRAPGAYICKRALIVRKRALIIRKRALCFALLREPCLVHSTSKGPPQMGLFPFHR